MCVFVSLFNFCFLFCSCDVSSLWLFFVSFADLFLLWFIWWLKQIKHHSSWSIWGFVSFSVSGRCKTSEWSDEWCWSVSVRTMSFCFARFECVFSFCVFHSSFLICCGLINRDVCCRGQFLAVTLSSGNGIKLRVQKIQEWRKQTGNTKCNLLTFVLVCLKRDRVCPEKYKVQPCDKLQGQKQRRVQRSEFIFWTLFFAFSLIDWFSRCERVDHALSFLFSLFVCLFWGSVMRLKRMCNWSSMVFFDKASPRFRLFLSDRKMRNLVMPWF